MKMISTKFIYMICIPNKMQFCYDTFLKVMTVGFHLEMHEDG